VLLVRKQFSMQAVSPLIYGLGTIVGGVLLVRQIGVSSLAIALWLEPSSGHFCSIGSLPPRRNALPPILDLHDEGFREWVRLSLPLMVGFRW